MQKLRNNIIIDESHCHSKKTRQLASFIFGFATATILIIFVEYLTKF